MKAFQVTFYGSRKIDGTGQWYGFEETKICTAKDMSVAQKKALKYLGRSKDLVGVKSYIEIGEAL